MGQGNLRFGCPSGTYRINEHSALHYHVYVDYGLTPDAYRDAFVEHIEESITTVCGRHSLFEYPTSKLMGSEMRVVAESPNYGVAVGDNGCSLAVFVYARDVDEKEDFLDQNVHNLALEVFWALRHYTPLRRRCAWTSAEYQGVPTST